MDRETKTTFWITNNINGTKSLSFFHFFLTSCKRAAEWPKLFHSKQKGTQNVGSTEALGRSTSMPSRWDLLSWLKIEQKEMQHSGDLGNTMGWQQSTAGKETASWSRQHVKKEKREDNHMTCQKESHFWNWWTGKQLLRCRHQLSVLCFPFTHL